MTHIECTCRGLDPDCPFGAKNFTKDIVRLAGHRNVPPWVMKLVADALAEERVALEAELLKLKKGIGANRDYVQGRWDLIGEFQDVIRARGEVNE